MSFRIVTYVHRYKRPPRKRAKASAIEAPTIVTIRSRKHAQAARHDAGGAKAPWRCRRCVVPGDEAPDRRGVGMKQQPALTNRKRPVFRCCPVCEVEFHVRGLDQRWCSTDCASLAKRRANAMLREMNRQPALDPLRRNRP